MKSSKLIKDPVEDSIESLKSVGSSGDGSKNVFVKSKDAVICLEDPSMWRNAISYGKWRLVKNINQIALAN